MQSRDVGLSGHFANLTSSWFYLRHRGHFVSFFGFSISFIFNIGISSFFYYFLSLINCSVLFDIQLLFCYFSFDSRLLLFLEFLLLLQVWLFREYARFLGGCLRSSLWSSIGDERFWTTLRRISWNIVKNLVESVHILFAQPTPGLALILVWANITWQRMSTLGGRSLSCTSLI